MNIIRDITPTSLLVLRRLLRALLLLLNMSLAESLEVADAAPGVLDAVPRRLQHLLARVRAALVGVA